MRMEQLLRNAGKWAILAAILAFAAPVQAQREFVVLPSPNAVSVPPGILAPPPQNAEPLSTIRIPENLPDKPAAPIGVERLPSRKSWMILSAVQHSAATFDAYSTRQAIGNGATEQDPFMRPFAGSPAIYAAIQVGPLLLDYAARKMQRSDHQWARKLWWVPQSASTAAYIASGVHNLNVTNQLAK